MVTFASRNDICIEPREELVTLNNMKQRGKAFHAALVSLEENWTTALARISFDMGISIRTAGRNISKIIFRTIYLVYFPRSTADAGI
jgi:hypothetical protein